MSFEITKHVWQLRLPTLQKFTLLALADHADGDGWCWPSVARLCAMTGAKERAVQGAIAAIEAAGYLVAERRPGRVTRYRLCVQTMVSTPAACTEVTQLATSSVPAVSAPPQQMRGLSNRSDTERVAKPNAPPQHLRETPAASADEPIKEPIKLARSASRKANRLKQRVTSTGFRQEAYAEALTAWRRAGADAPSFPSPEGFFVGKAAKGSPGSRKQLATHINPAPRPCVLPDARQAA